MAMWIQTQVSASPTVEQEDMEQQSTITEGMWKHLLATLAPRAVTSAPQAQNVSLALKVTTLIPEGITPKRQGLALPRVDL